MRTMQPGSCGNHTLKLVVNSHVSYEPPLRMLIASLREAGFLHWRDLIIVLAGCEDDAMPVACEGSDTLCPQAATLVKTRQNIYDWTGLSVLSKHREHPLVRAHTYLFLHDTCVVDESFPRKFESYRLPRNGLILTTWPPPNSNIAVLGSGVVRAMRRNFDVSFTKTDGYQLEYGYRLVQRSTNRTILPLTSFGSIVGLGARRCDQGGTDPYKTKMKRMKCHYPALGVSKFILPQMGTRRAEFRGTARRDGLARTGEWRKFDHRGMQIPPERPRYALEPRCWSQHPHLRPASLDLFHARPPPTEPEIRGRG